MLRNLTSVFLVPLIPAVVLYYLFQGDNIAEYIRASEGIKLGGPAALYVILVVLAIRYVNTDPLGEVKKSLVGSWEITARSAGTDATSDCEISLKNDQIKISGGQFVEGERPIGTWQVEKLFLSPESLTWFYNLTESAGSKSRFRGLVELNIQGSGKDLRLSGSWEVLGPEENSGTIELTRKSR